MRTLASLVLSLSLAACASSQYAERQAPVPPGASARGANVPIQQQQLLRTGPADSEATRKWLEQEIERNRYVPPPPPPAPAPQVVVRREYVPVDRHAYHHEVYDDGYYVRSPYASRSTFPWHTAVGAGLGAVIGHQSGHRSEGAWIGAGYGLLLDLCRW